MFKVFFLIHRNPALSGPEFFQHWREIHGPLLLATPDVNRHFLRYIQNRPDERGRRNFTYDGVAVTWLAALDDLAKASAEPAFAPLWDDGTVLLDRSRSTVVAMRPQGAELQGGAAKVVMFLRRLAEMDAAAFQDQIGHQAKAAFAGQAYVLNLPELLSTARFGAGELDAIVELSFGDPDAAVAYAAAEGERAFRVFVDSIDADASSWAVVQERVVFPPAA